MKKFIVKTSLMTVPPLLGGMDVRSNREFDNLKDAKKYAKKFKNFLADKIIKNGLVEYTDEERDFFWRRSCVFIL